MNPNHNAAYWREQCAQLKRQVTAYKNASACLIGVTLKRCVLHSCDIIQCKIINECGAETRKGKA